ncbi:MAG TPA: tetratricopeptide repeat protein [Vicinamibacterales bacterium]|nr:tetratricopeptide repeat protein [Vicinamibacterales bacterium]
MAARLGVVAFVSFVMLGVGCARVDPDEHARKAEAYFTSGDLASSALEYRVAVQAAPKRGDLRMKLAEVYIRTANYREAIAEAARAADLSQDDAAVQVKVGNILIMGGDFEQAQMRAQRALALAPNDVDAMLLLGNAQAGLKQFDAAIRQFQDVIALRPADGQPYVNLASVLHGQGKRAEAEATFRRAVAAAPNSAITHLGLANWLWSTGRIKDAEQSIIAALALEPESAAANRALVTLYLATNRTAVAEPYIRTLVKVTNTPEATLFLADYYVSLNKPDEARRVLVELSAKSNGFVVANVRLAALEASAGQRLRAMELVDAVLAKYPNDSAAHVMHARLLRAERRFSEALGEVNAVVKQEPSAALTSVAYLLMGQIAADTDRFEEAVKAYNETLKRDPQSMGALLALGALHIANGAAEKAAGYVNNALQIEPKSLHARALAVRVLLAKNDRARAAIALAALRKDAPDSVLVLNLIAAQQLADGQLEAARATYLKAIQASPKDVEATTGLVKIDLGSGRTKDALARVEEHLKATPPSPDFLVLAAQTYAQVGHPDKVEENLKKAIQVAPERMAGYSLLGVYYANHDRLKEAQAQFEELVRRNPNSVWAGTMLGMVLESLGKLPEAEDRYKTVIALGQPAPIAANNLSYIYLVTNREMPTAFQLAQMAYLDSPREAHISDTLGWAHYLKNETAAAISKLEESVKRDARNPVSQYHLGMAYLLAGDAGAAKKTLQVAATIGRGDIVTAAKTAIAKIDAQIPK